MRSFFAFFSILIFSGNAFSQNIYDNIRCTIKLDGEDPVYVTIETKTSSGDMQYARAEFKIGERTIRLFPVIVLNAEHLPNRFHLRVSEVNQTDKSTLWSQQVRYSQAQNFSDYATLDLVHTINPSDMSKEDLISCGPGYKPEL